MVLHEYYFGQHDVERERHAVSGTSVHDAVAEASAISIRGREISRQSAACAASAGRLRIRIRTGRISNHWITLHEDGNVAGYEPIVVMDAWEHAFLLDYKPAERSKYIEAFFANVDWRAFAKRGAKRRTCFLSLDAR